MARPKEQVPLLSAAFQEKCSKERLKLQQRLANQLRADMERYSPWAQNIAYQSRWDKENEGFIILAY